jgi:hypothetical protein
MNRQWKGIVFIDFREENAPHFILDLIEELQREKIAESIAPCQTFAKSFMMVSPATGRKDLTLLLRPLSEDSMNRLENWRNNQGEQVVMVLSEYVTQYTAEFTGIVQPAKTNDPDRAIEQKSDDPPRKSKKNRRKKDKSAETSGEDSAQVEGEFEAPSDGSSDLPHNEDIQNAE